MSEGTYDRYLRLLGIPARPSGLDGLRLLIRRHLASVPFENISKLMVRSREGAGRPITLTEFLDGIEFSDLGGTCYVNNPFFSELLGELGYDAELLGADMSQPNLHSCIRVRMHSTSYLVDVGFCAPFREPMPLGDVPFDLTEGVNRYLVDRVSAGFRLSTFQGDKPGEVYIAHDPPRKREFFNDVVVRSFATSAMFMRRIRVGKVFDSHSVDLIDRRLFRHEAGKTAVTQIDSMSAMKAVMEEQFAMPRCPIEAAIAVVEGHTGQAFF